MNAPTELHAPTGLRLLGTGYEGKEPLEHTADVLRAATRLTGAELGFETCLTSRPFTARTFVSERPGGLLPGRPIGADDPAARAVTDLTDGLDALTAAGFTVEVCAAAPRPQPGSVLLAGPLPVPGRWAPAAEQLLVGALWRHLVVDRVHDGIATCLDPAFGGYTAVDVDQLAAGDARFLLVRAPATAVDTAVMARRALRAGARWRTSSAGPDRDEAGFAALADAIARVDGGSTTHRLRLMLAAHALHALRWAALLGHCGPLTTGELALADLLGGSVEHCRTAQLALTVRDLRAAATAVQALAVTAAATTELCQREV